MKRTWRALAAIVVSLALISPVSAQTEDTALAWRDVEPGYYALVEANVAVLGATVALPGSVTIGCMHAGAPVFLLEPGEASLIRVDGFTRQTTRAADNAILAEFDRAVAERPRAFSERAIVTPVGVASWPEQSGMVGLTRNCHEPDSFEFVASEP